MILIGCTDFFEKAVSETSGFFEASTRTVTFPEHSPRSVKAFLEYCYNESYSFEEGRKKASFDLEVYIFADYIIATGLKALSAKNFHEHVAPASRAEFVGFWTNELPDLVTQIYSSTGAGQEHYELRSGIVELVAREMMRKDASSHGPLMNVMSAHGDFAASLLDKYSTLSREDPFRGHKHQKTCSSCNSITVLEKMSERHAASTVVIHCAYCQHSTGTFPC